MNSLIHSLLHQPPLWLTRTSVNCSTLLALLRPLHLRGSKAKRMPMMSFGDRKNDPRLLITLILSPPYAIESYRCLDIFCPHITLSQMKFRKPRNDEKKTKKKCVLHIYVCLCVIVYIYIYACMYILFIFPLISLCYFFFSQWRDQSKADLTKAKEKEHSEKDKVRDRIFWRLPLGRSMWVHYTNSHEQPWSKLSPIIRFTVCCSSIVSRPRQGAAHGC